MNETSLEEYFICGGFGGMCAVIVGHPFDTIKVRLQTMHVPKPGEPPLYLGAWHCFQCTVKNEGFRGLFKGMSFPLMSVAPIFAISFLAYGIGKQMFGPSDGSHITYRQLFAAGAFSGFCSAFVTAPGERIKCLLQIQQNTNIPKRYTGAFDCINKIYKQAGLIGIYRGMGVTILREIPSSGIYFVTYETVKESTTIFTNQISQKFHTILAGGSAGIAYWLTGLPADVLKSRVQTAPDSQKTPKIRTIFTQLVRNEGPTALYKGITPVLIRAFLANAACFLGFDICKDYIKYLSQECASVHENVHPIGQKPDDS